MVSLCQKKISTESEKEIGGKQTQYNQQLLKRFIQEYRLFLNHLQLWYVRTEFDVSFGQLHRFALFRRYEMSFNMRTELYFASFQDKLARNSVVPDASDEMSNQAVSQQLYQSTEAISKAYKYGFQTDPLDRKPFEMSAKCFFCGASFSVESQVKNYLATVQIANQNNVKMISSPLTNN